jgi:hypothetical protein
LKKAAEHRPAGRGGPAGEGVVVTRRVLAAQKGRTSRPTAGSWNAGLVAPCLVEDLGRLLGGVVSQG